MEQLSNFSKIRDIAWRPCATPHRPDESNPPPKTGMMMPKKTPLLRPEVTKHGTT